MNIRPVLGLAGLLMLAVLLLGLLLLLNVLAVSQTMIGGLFMAVAAAWLMSNYPSGA